MGFSLFGSSGDQKTTNNTSTTTNTTTYSANNNPQISQDGAAAGTVAINVAPLSQGGSISDFGVDISTAYAPLNVTSTGDIMGDAAAQALADMVKTQQTVPTGTMPASKSTDGTGLGSLFTSDNMIYWVLGAVVILFLSHHK